MLPHSTWYLKVCFDVNERKSVPIIQYQFGIINAELFCVPILN